MSPAREDESASNLLRRIPTGSLPGGTVSAAYTAVLIGAGAAALACELFAKDLSLPSLPYVNAAFVLAGCCWFAAFLRLIRSPATPIATPLVSALLAFWFPLGTIVFLYWFFRVRRLEAGGGGGDRPRGPRDMLARAGRGADERDPTGTSA